MLNGYSKLQPTNVYRRRAMPSCYHFSKLFNSSFAEVSQGIVGIIGGGAGIVLMLALSFVLGVSVLLASLAYAVLIYTVRSKLMVNHWLVGDKELEIAYNNMPENKRKEYKEFLIEGYRTTKAEEAAIELFRRFKEVRATNNVVFEKLQLELKAVEDAQQIYEESLNDA